MKILLLGKHGQVGWELQRALAPLGSVVGHGRRDANLENPDTLRRLLQQLAPDVIVNAAAYTAVDKAETEEELAFRVNAAAVAVLAEESRRLGAWLVHYSTDYVFDGRKDGFYDETDLAAPQSVYGRSKLKGEQAIVASGCKHLIFRTSWVYATRGSNFAKTMLRLAAERETLKVVSDQIGAPTGAELIADVTALVLNRLRHDAALSSGASGIYHLAAGGEVSWHGYAQKVIAAALAAGVKLKVVPGNVLPILAKEYPVAAPRPSNSRLATHKLRDTFGLSLPDWQHPVERLVAELCG